MDWVVGVSRCLLGEQVRYDAKVCGHPAVSALGALWTWAPLCPEVAAGMSVPRPPIDWVGDRIFDRARGIDHTDALQAAVSGVGAGLDGFILKARSPSCGIGNAAFYPQAGAAKAAHGVDGILVAQLRARWPDLPLADEATVAADPMAFVRRVAAHHAARTGQPVNRFRLAQAQTFVDAL
jgi:uncharacterized protein YbbK (DUF523 family)